MLDFCGCDATWDELRGLDNGRWLGKAGIISPRYLVVYGVIQCGAVSSLLPPRARDAVAPPSVPCFIDTCPHHPSGDSVNCSIDNQNGTPIARKLQVCCGPLTPPTCVPQEWAVVQSKVL